MDQKKRKKEAPHLAMLALVVKTEQASTQRRKNELLLSMLYLLEIMQLEEGHQPIIDGLKLIQNAGCTYPDRIKAVIDDLSEEMAEKKMVDKAIADINRSSSGREIAGIIALIDPKTLLGSSLERLAETLEKRVEALMFPHAPWATEWLDKARGILYPELKQEEVNHG